MTEIQLLKNNSLFITIINQGDQQIIILYKLIYLSSLILYTKMEYRKAITYQSFMQLPAEKRRQHSTFFKNTYPEYFPVMLQVLHGNKEIVLKMCKFLIRRNKSIIAEQEVIKDFVLKHSQGAIAKTDQIVFVHSGKLVNQNVSVGEFLEKWYRDEEEDGWLHYKAVTQDVFG